MSVVLVVLVVLVTVVAVSMAVVIVVVIIVAVALAGSEPRPDAGRRQRSLHHPVAEVHAQRIDRLRVRDRIRGEESGAVGIARAIRAGDGQETDLARRIAGQTRIEATTAAAVRAARNVVAAHVLRQRDVFLRVRAHPFRSELQRPDFRRAEVFDDLRAGV